MIRAYEELVDFIAAAVTPAALSQLEASRESKERVADLIERQKSGSLTPDEGSELDQYLKLEHVMRLAKARAQARSPQ
jgi:hypothetical protein